jgi:hypothetical protein
LDIAELSIRNLTSQHYVKPIIEVGNYYLKWDTDSYGIHQNETQELKKFVSNAIPFFDTSYQLLSSLERPKYKDKLHLYKQLSPHILISHRIKDRHRVTYELHMGSDGSTVIDRVEELEATGEEDNESMANRENLQRHHFRMLYIKWNIGELLFNRQGSS